MGKRNCRIASMSGTDGEPEAQAADQCSVHTISNQNTYEGSVIPGENIIFSLYWMGDDTQKPEPDWIKAQTITLKETGQFTDYDFQETIHRAAIYDKGYHDVYAFSKEDVLDDEVDTRIYYYWWHNSKTEKVIPCDFALYTPSGGLYTWRDSYTLNAENSEGNIFFFSQLIRLFKDYQRLDKLNRNG